VPEVERWASGVVDHQDDTTHALLSDLTSVLLGLEMLVRSTELSARQRLLAEMGLAAAQALRGRLLAQLGGASLGAVSGREEPARRLRRSGADTRRPRRGRHHPRA